MNFKEAYDICLKKAKRYETEVTEKPCTAFGYDGKQYKYKDDIESFWCWTNSHLVGMPILAAHTEKDFSALRWANSFAPHYSKKVNNVPVLAMHDIGFLYLHYSVHLYMLTGDLGHRATALKAADELIKRFDINARVLEAWSEAFSEEKENRMIIDCMMNNVLLFWAWKETGYTIYRDMAVAHIETYIKTLVRDDYSVCHAWFFDHETGKPTEEANTCGFANGSYWARGTAWMVFGLAAAYGYTKNEEYYDLAVKIAEKFIEELKEDDFIPVWDFRLPEDMPARACRPADKTAAWDETKPENKIYNRDSSAAAIISCAIMLLDNSKKTPSLTEAADKMMQSLCDNYFDSDIENQAMLVGANGQNTSSIYGDYYFMLALAMKNYGPEMWKF